MSRFDASSWPRWATALGLIGLLCLAAILRLRLLPHIPMSDYMLRQTLNAHHLLRGGHAALQIDQLTYGAPGFTYLYLQIPALLLTDHLYGVCALFLLLHLGAVILCHRVGTVFFGSRAGWIAAALLATSPFAARYLGGALYNSYILTPFVVLFFYALLSYGASGRGRFFTACCVLALILGQIYIIASVQAFLSIVVVCLLCRRIPSGRAVAATAILLLLLLLPFFITHYWDAHHDIRKFADSRIEVTRGFLDILGPRVATAAQTIHSMFLYPFAGSWLDQPLPWLRWPLIALEALVCLLLLIALVRVAGQGVSSVASRRGLPVGEWVFLPWILILAVVGAALELNSTSHYASLFPVPYLFAAAALVRGASGSRRLKAITSALVVICCAQAALAWSHASVLDTRNSFPLSKKMALARRLVDEEGVSGVGDFLRRVRLAGMDEKMSYLFCVAACSGESLHEPQLRPPSPGPYLLVVPEGEEIEIEDLRLVRHYSADGYTIVRHQGLGRGPGPAPDSDRELLSTDGAVLRLRVSQEGSRNTGADEHVSTPVQVRLDYELDPAGAPLCQVSFTVQVVIRSSKFDRFGPGKGTRTHPYDLRDMIRRYLLSWRPEPPSWWTETFYLLEAEAFLRQDPAGGPSPAHGPTDLRRRVFIPLSGR